ncbi:MAG: SAM-dependent methyltransferase [Rhodospirillales bacterium]
MPEPKTATAPDPVAAHWAQVAASYDQVLETLRTKGLRPDEATVRDLHAFDMLHMGGAAATEDLGRRAALGKGEQVLDLGSGLGGPARLLAQTFGAQVTGIDLSPVLCDTAERLTRLVGLQDRVRFRCASALNLPFDDGTFDLAVLQHLAMQIADKDLLFAEISRVTGKASRLALHEIFAGTGPVHYPLPWAPGPDLSALESLDDCRDRLRGLGWKLDDVIDHSDAARRFHAKAVQVFDTALRDGCGTDKFPPAAIPGQRAISAAMVDNLAQGALKVGMLIARRT